MTQEKMNLELQWNVEAKGQLRAISQILGDLLFYTALDERYLDWIESVVAKSKETELQLLEDENDAIKDEVAQCYLRGVRKSLSHVRERMVSLEEERRAKYQDQPSSS